MGRAKQQLARRRESRKRGMPPERWAVTGTDRYGEPFESDHTTRGEADTMASRVNGRGGSVEVRRKVWDSPAAAYRVPRCDEA